MVWHKKYTDCLLYTSAYQETDEQQFLELCELAENVVKRRIEQLPEVDVYKRQMWKHWLQENLDVIYVWVVGM